jgi:hypothetical protein
MDEFSGVVPGTSVFHYFQGPAVMMREGCRPDFSGKVGFVLQNCSPKLFLFLASTVGIDDGSFASAQSIRTGAPVSVATQEAMAAHFIRAAKAAGWLVRLHLTQQSSASISFTMLA